MIRKAILLLALAALPAACGSGREVKGTSFVPGAYASEPQTRKMVVDTGEADTAHAGDTLRADTLSTRLAGSPRNTGLPRATGGGVMDGRGTMGRRGMMGGMMGRGMGMMGSGSQAPPAAATTAADTGACPQITQALVDEGRQVFTGRGNCATCHGANGQGGALAPDLTDTTWLNIDGSYASIAAIVKSGVPQPKQHPAPMPPMGGASLSTSQVCAVAGYVYSLSHKH